MKKKAKIIPFKTSEKPDEKCIKVIVALYDEDIDMTDIITPNHTISQAMMLTRLRHLDTDIQVVADPVWDPNVITLYYVATLHGINIMEYITPEYSHLQVEQLIEALAEDLDITEMNNVSKSPGEMESIRNRLEVENDLEATSLLSFDRGDDSDKWRPNESWNITIK